MVSELVRVVLFGMAAGIGVAVVVVPAWMLAAAWTEYRMAEAERRHHRNPPTRRPEPRERWPR